MTSTSAKFSPKKTDYSQLALERPLLTKLTKMYSSSSPSLPSPTQSLQSLKLDDTEQSKDNHEEMISYHLIKKISPASSNFSQWRQHQQQKKTNSNNNAQSQPAHRFPNLAAPRMTAAEKRHEAKRKTKENAKSADKAQEQDDIIGEEEERIRMKPRVERFLSIVDLPPEVAFFNPIKSGAGGMGDIGEEDEDNDDDDDDEAKATVGRENNDQLGKTNTAKISEEDTSGTTSKPTNASVTFNLPQISAQNDQQQQQQQRKTTTATAGEDSSATTPSRSRSKTTSRPSASGGTSADSAERKRQLLASAMSARNNVGGINGPFATSFGSTLSQQAKKEIIRSIIDNFNVDKYLSEFKSSHHVQISLKNKYT